jgi:hypothetical protein
MWFSETVKISKSVIDFSARQEEYIQEHPEDWFDNEPLFCEEKLKPLSLLMIEGKNLRTSVEERKADRDPPRGDRVLWRIGRFYGDCVLDTKKYFLLMRLERFWTDERTLSILVPIITRRTMVTPCLLDFLCVNHSKNPEIVYPWDIRGNSQLINIFKNYNLALKLWHRGCFDPHRRVDPLKPDRVWFDVGEETHSTTAAQLFFLHWCWAHGIFHYAQDHFDEIKADHMSAQQARKRKRDMKEKGGKQKREEIKKAISSQCKMYLSTTSIDAFYSEGEDEEDEE